MDALSRLKWLALAAGYDEDDAVGRAEKAYQAVRDEVVAAQEVAAAQAQDAEVRIALQGLLRNLRDVRAQRAVSASVTTRPGRAAGELWGLDTAIKAVERRLQ
jgi:hypothetical protein